MSDKRCKENAVTDKIKARQEGKVLYPFFLSSNILAVKLKSRLQSLDDAVHSPVAESIEEKAEN